jgi:hypothetical protein
MEPMQEVDNVKALFLGGNAVAEFVFRYSLNMAMTFLLVRWLYYQRHQNKDFVFTFFLFNTVIFLICSLLSSATIRMGFAFGLFAIFSIFRYRTVTIPVREMGYFFLVVAIGIINALGQLLPDATLMLLGNAVMFGTTYMLDRKLALVHENHKPIKYDKLDLILPQKRAEMLEDLKTRTGLDIHRIEVLSMDFLKQICEINAFYYSKDNDSAIDTGGGGDD